MQCTPRAKQEQRKVIGVLVEISSLYEDHELTSVG